MTLKHQRWMGFDVDDQFFIGGQTTITPALPLPDCV